MPPRQLKNTRGVAKGKSLATGKSGGPMCASSSIPRRFLLIFLVYNNLQRVYLFWVFLPKFD
jgi:hypothetical protein